MAQWAAVPLQTPAFGASEIFAASGTVFGGQARFGVGNQQATHPVVWNGLGGAWTDLAEQPLDDGRVLGASGDRQVGVLRGHASVWQGTVQSRIDLNPQGITVGSEALGIAGTRIAGDAYVAPITPHACVWNGASASSFVDLHPGVNGFSTATAIDGEFEGGWVQLPGFAGEHAAIWHGTAQSWTDLNPNPSWVSEILGMATGQQVGWVFGPAAGGLIDHAAMWNGSAASFVDMNPPGAGLSHLLGTCGSAQVGYANIPQYGNTAGIWFGTAKSFVPLGSFLPPGFAQSVATTVSFENGAYYVGGYATRSVDGVDEAWVWVGVPAPGSAMVFLGLAALAAGRGSRRTRAAL